MSIDSFDFLETIIDSLSGGVAVGHKQRGLVMFNSAARELLGQRITDAPRGPVRWLLTTVSITLVQIRFFPTDELPMVQALKGKTLRGPRDPRAQPAIPHGRVITADAYPIAGDLGVVVFRDHDLREKFRAPGSSRCQRSRGSR